MEYRSKSLEMTEVLAICVASVINRPTVILLNGELGAGKTVLTQKIARNIGIDQNVTSPTFNIVKEYQGRLPLHHADLYRIGAEEFIDLGYLEEIGINSVGIIEWGSKIRPLLSEYLLIEITIIDEQSRLFDISGYGREGNRMMAELQKCLL